MLDTDASAEAIGAELCQVQEGRERPIAYGSLTLSAEQRRYCTTRKELLAVIRFTRMYRHYLLGRRFIVRTDHHSLIWLLNFRYPQDQLARWLEELSQYNMVIQHRPGRRHVNADALSRPTMSSRCQGVDFTVNLSDLPCGGCHKCTRAHQLWNVFADEVDDVAPLARPESWIYFPLSEDEPEGVADSNALSEAQPFVSEIALGYVSSRRTSRTNRQFSLS